MEETRNLYYVIWLLRMPIYLSKPKEPLELKLKNGKVNQSAKTASLSRLNKLQGADQYT